MQLNMCVLTSTTSEDSELSRCLTGMHKYSRLMVFSFVFGNPFEVEERQNENKTVFYSLRCYFNTLLLLVFFSFMFIYIIRHSRCQHTYEYTWTRKHSLHTKFPLQKKLQYDCCLLITFWILNVRSYDYVRLIVFNKRVFILFVFVFWAFDIHSMNWLKRTPSRIAVIILSVSIFTKNSL